jgi:DNA-directed RNA polymerase subunit M/transcription elongation factor TFIIS
MRVLIADGDDASLEVAQRYLSHHGHEVKPSRELKMQRNGHATLGDAHRRVPDVVGLSRKATLSRSRGRADQGQSPISNDRPVYACPKCLESAMQFYTASALYPDRTEFFHCHSCGTHWEI